MPGNVDFSAFLSDSVPLLWYNSLIEMRRKDRCRWMPWNFSSANFATR